MGACPIGKVCRSSNELAQGGKAVFVEDRSEVLRIGIGNDLRNGENGWALVSDRSRRICFWYRHVKAIEGNRDEAIEPNQIN